MEKTEEHKNDYPKITENMWCWNCEHEWETDDYFNCNTCPNCKTKPMTLYRTSSTSYVYAYMNKHPEQNPFKKTPPTS